MKPRGFTLIELLIVIAIVAILAAAVVVLINPADLLRQARDTTRLSDMNTLRKALTVYVADATTPNMASSTFGNAACYLSTPTGAGTSTAKCGAFAGKYTALATNASTTTSTLRNIDSTGWLPVNLKIASFGSTMSSLPVDPINNSQYYYAYATGGSNLFEIDTQLESTKYMSKESLDGGDNVNFYEVGNAIDL